MRCRSFVVLASAALAAACSFSDLGGLSGTTHDDAGSAGDATAPDGDGGTTTSDGAPLGDAGGGGDGGLFCDGITRATNVFCADFDRGAVAAGWTAPFVDDGGLVTLDTTAFVSAPASYLARIGAMDTSATSLHAYMHHELTTRPTYVRYEFDLRPDALSSADDAIQLMSIVVLGAVPQTGYSIQLLLRSSGAYIGEQVPIDAGVSSFVTHPLSAAPPVGKWTRVRIDATLVGNRTVTVSLDGVKALDAQPLVANANPGPVWFYLGTIYGHGPSTGFTLHFDDVTVDTSDASPP